MEMLGCLLLAWLAGFALLCQVELQVHAQDQSGFISLDCGSPKDSNYPESTTGIRYISDASFIETGKSRSILPKFRTNVTQPMWQLRSFPDGTRNCYTFRLKMGDKYLIRANFIYGNYDAVDDLPAFDLHLGPNFWDSVILEDASTPLTMELIHVLSADNLYICLVNTGAGTPFISALELRHMKNTIYETKSGSLNLFARFDIGSIKTIRYQDDLYDRVWLPYNFNGWKQISTENITDADSHNDFQPPSIVMSTAAIPRNASDDLHFYLTSNDSFIQIYVYMHFAEVQELQANESRHFNISLNGEHWYGPLIPDYLHTTTVYSPSALSGGEYNFSIYKTEGSTLPPLINAFEVYVVYELLKLQTDQKDVDAITNIKSTYGLKRNWQGDPCAPKDYQWDGLNCSLGDPPRIISLNLSSCGLTGKITEYISNLTMIQILDLSNNNLTGPVPEFLSQLPLLRFLNLTGNKLNGSVPVELIERSKNGSLILSVRANPHLCSLASSCKRRIKLLVPVVASVASFSVLVIAIAILCNIRRRKKQVAQVDANSKLDQSVVETTNGQFTYSDILKITSNFQRVLGKGGFGTVYHGCLGDTQVAVKMLLPPSAQGYKQFQAEVKLLLKVHHRNLTRLLGYCDEGTNLGLIYEFMANGNLAEHLSEGRADILSWERRLRIAMDAAQGLEYLHTHCKPPIIHRDVKSSNILISKDFQAKLADFGLSRAFLVEDDTHVSTFAAGTPGYLDPEYYISNGLSQKSDVYSFGVILLEMITSRPVITNTHDTAHISEWVSFMLIKGDVRNMVDPRLRGDFDIKSVWKALDLALACVSPTSMARPTIRDVLMELSECLETEMARKRWRDETESNNAYE